MNAPGKPPLSRSLGKRIDTVPPTFVQPSLADAAIRVRWPGNRIFEDFSAKTLVTPDGGTAIRVAVEGYNHLWQLSGPTVLLDDPRFANPWARVLPCGPDLFQLQGEHGSASWVRLTPEGATALGIAEDMTPVASADGTRLLVHETSPVFRTAHPGTDLWIGDFAERTHVLLDGPVMAACFAPDGACAYVLVRQPDAASTLVRVATADGAVEKIAVDLDTPPYPPASVYIAASGTHVYLPAVGTRAPDDHERQKPYAPRETRLYRIAADSGAMELVVNSQADIADISIAGDTLFWVRSVCEREVVALPVDGGEAHRVVHGGYIPEWDPAGGRLGYTIGQFRLADWAVCLDAYEVCVDAEARPVTEPAVVVQGSHEDFTHVYSPCGRWIAYHTHRGVGFPIAYYDAPDFHDAIFVRAAEDIEAPEFEVSENGWEIYGAAWSPDSRKLYYQSWDRQGFPGLYDLFVVDFDPDTGAKLGHAKLPKPEGLVAPTLFDLSPDGTIFAIEDSFFPGQRALWLMSVDGTTGRRLCDYRSHTYAGVTFAKDGKSVVFAGLDDAERMVLFRISVDGGEPVQISTDSSNLMHPRISPDGRWIAATRHMTVQELWSARIVA
ncbi:MAG: hypothetical protein WDN24_14670 [Sphingomonas sp.]